MRKLYIILVLISFVSVSFAQRQSVPSNKVFTADKAFFTNNSKAITDTIIPLPMSTASGYTIYGSANGGYICGTNGYGDYAKAQVFPVGTGEGYKVYGVLVWFAAKTIIGTANNVVCSINPLTGTATASTGNVPGPGATALLTKTLSTNDVDTGTSMTFTAFMFDQQHTVLTDYAVVIDVQNTYDDTVGIVSTVEGDGWGMELAMEKWNDGSWYTLTGAGWGSSDFDMCIFPVVEMNTGMEDVFVDGVKMNSYPNPANESVAINYEIQKDANVTIYVTDMTGKQVIVSEEGAKQAGAHQSTIDVSNLASGNYMYIINAGSQRLAKMLIVE